MLCTNFRLTKPVNGLRSCAPKSNQTKQENLVSTLSMLAFKFVLSMIPTTSHPGHNS